MLLNTPMTINLINQLSYNDFNFYSEEIFREKKDSIEREEQAYQNAKNGKKIYVNKDK